MTTFVHMLIASNLSNLLSFYVEYYTIYVFSVMYSEIELGPN